MLSLVYVIFVIVMLCIVVFSISHIHTSYKMAQVLQRLEQFERKTAEIQARLDEANNDGGYVWNRAVMAEDEQKAQEAAEKSYAEGVSNILSYNIGKGLV